MALFGRRQPAESDVPPDLQQYYSSNNGGIGRWVARVVLFLVVLALLVWGGVALFQKLTKDDNKQTAQNNPSNSQQQGSGSGNQNNPNPAPTPAPTSPNPTPQSSNNGGAKPAPAPAPTPAPSATPSTPPPATPSPAPQPAPAPAPTPSPTPTAPQTATGGSGGGSGSSNLPNTGPGETAVALFAGAAVLGTLFHMIFLRRKPAR